MKFAIWAYTAAVTLTALFTVALGVFFENFFLDQLKDLPLPGLSDFFLHLGWWVFLAVLPFFLVAYWLTFRSALTTSRAFAFAGAATLMIIFLFVVPIVSFCFHISRF